MPEIKEHILKTSEGFELSLLNYGARVRSIKIPLNGKLINVALGYQDIETYPSDEFYLGATIGRFCNRIHGGEITIKNQTYSLPTNEAKNVNTLHGGYKGFDKHFWELSDESDEYIEFKLLSSHLDQGFPGNLNVYARYTVDELGFSVEYSATCDQDTVINLCNHTYFNLDGFNLNDSNSIKQHRLLLNADNYLPLNNNQVPNGELQRVTNTPFDFANTSKNSQDRLISTALESSHHQIELTGGLDHSFINNSQDDLTSQAIAQLYSTKTNIALKVFTTQTVVHVYSGNYLDNPFDKHAGICFETQGYPDAPNHKHFPSAVLKAGETYHNKTTYQFEILK